MNAATTWGNGFCLVGEFKVMLFQNSYTRFRSVLLPFRDAQFIACKFELHPFAKCTIEYLRDPHKNDNPWGLDFLFWNLLKSYEVVKFLPYENISTNAPVLWSSNGLDFRSKLWCIYQNSRAGYDDMLTIFQISNSNLRGFYY